VTLPVFHAPRADLTSGAEIHVGGSEGRHASTVRRLRVGEQLALTDGQGLVARGTVTAVARDGLVVAVAERDEVPRPTPTLVVVQALPKGDRGELAVELMSEIGVDVIVPWAAHRCVARWEGDRAERGMSRWRSTAREAAKQSRRAWWPTVEPLASTADVVRRIAGADRSYVLNEAATTPLASETTSHDGEVVVVVGPEGGVTPVETDEFLAAGAHSVSIGPNVLRTSTAGLVAAVVLLAGAPRWSTR
jgi:16S rRNA (uracil1498-N3)-methyltransferase